MSSLEELCCAAHARVDVVSYCALLSVVPFQKLSCPFFVALSPQPVIRTCHVVTILFVCTLCASAIPDVASTALPAQPPKYVTKEQAGETLATTGQFCTAAGCTARPCITATVNSVKSK